MKKGRLESIKETWKSESTSDLDNEDVEWLINQAEMRQLERGASILANKFNTAFTKEVMEENTLLREANMLNPEEEWHDDDGDVIWWKLPIEEPPYIGSPLCDDFTFDYYTHFTRIVIPLDYND